MCVCVCVCVCECVCKEKLLATVFESYQKAPFSIATAPFPGLPHFTSDTYLILLSVKQVGIKYHF